MMVLQTAKLATTATPIPIRHSTTFFELPHKKRKQRRLLEEEQRQKALLEAEEESRSLAWNYIVDFLHASEWCDQMDQITVVYEAVPTMEELESYGELDEKEGTRASRKLFKAPVVWDELGHGLWKLLSATAAEQKQQRRQHQLQLQQQQQQQQQPQALVTEEPAAKPICWNSSFACYTDLSRSVSSSRRSSSRRTSEDSCSTAISQDSMSHRMSLSSSPCRQGSIPRIFSRITSRRSNS
ncbi:hypothetical protein E4U42_002121 [Claviceps africana]|uniref:Uncharacterized protein n=1 Tax=Claviceps africana TaxID=83212 RepID=A0A8K0J8S8_9HYPO|nr:hypothetical protein E4U42_002121 [Claviceps africana]